MLAKIFRAGLADDVIRIVFIDEECRQLDDVLRWHAFGRKHRNKIRIDLISLLRERCTNRAVRCDRHLSGNEQQSRSG